MRIHESRLTGSPGGGAALLWDLSKPHVHPRLQAFSYDIGALRTALIVIVRSVVPPEQAPSWSDAAHLRSCSRASTPPGSSSRSRSKSPPLADTAPAGASAAPLTEAELAALDAALQPWDAFLAYTIKQLALDSEDRALRQRLFTLLLESRYELTAILSGETRTAGDPVRALFIDTWGELRAILADARYTVFLDAGDALVALDRAAPGLGMRVSADGLRQLARSLGPAPPPIRWLTTGPWIRNWARCSTSSPFPSPRPRLPAEAGSTSSSPARMPRTRSRSINGCRRGASSLLTRRASASCCRKHRRANCTAAASPHLTTASTAAWCRQPRSSRAAGGSTSCAPAR